MDALVERARAYAANAYGSEAELEHPLEVARLVARAGFPPEVVAAAVLHDIVEDTEVEVPELAARFGSYIAALVSTLTEDESISGYAERKRELRGRASAAGRDACVIFVADKLSNARRMRGGKKDPKARKVAHYAATLELMRTEHPDLPLLGELEREIAALRAAQRSHA